MSLEAGACGYGLPCVCPPELISRVWQAELGLWAKLTIAWEGPVEQVTEEPVQLLRRHQVLSPLGPVFFTTTQGWRRGLRSRGASRLGGERSASTRATRFTLV